MLASRSARRLAASALLLGASAGSVFALRRAHKPYVPDAPAYRQSGPEDAPVVIAEFSDFQCPACAAAVAPVKQLIAMHEDRIRVVFKHLPWDFHPHSRPAALAAECAGRQGRFWPMHDLLFARQRSWSESRDAARRFEAYARELKLDAAAFRACVGDPATGSLVDRDFRESEERWINSTPTFFIGGRRFVGGRQLREGGLREIERLLAGEDER